MTKLFLRFNWDSRRLRGFIAGAVAIVLAMACVFGWIHLDKARDRLNSLLPGLRATASEMRRLAMEAQRLRDVLGKTAPDSSSAAAISVTVSESALTSGLQGAVVAPLDSKRARVHFESVSFNDYFRWVGDIQSEYGVRIESLHMESLSKPGRVSVNAVVFRP